MLTFTDKARERVLEFMDQGGDDLRALRLLVDGGSPLAPSFELTLVADSDRTEGDVAVEVGGFTVFVDPTSAERMGEARVDFVERVNESGFEIVPLRGPLASKGPDGPLADRVKAILDEQVNPAIAAHGGRIDLVEVRGTEIYMMMSGGCQGCAMSRMTLRQGVERQIREAVPEVTVIHDVTDHDAGESPFYES
ncbi:MAG: iron-sulfur cluster assembly accessory protein [Gemmatimonadetes bacterium]|nr:iron-sulfur cluster assembly accessory protein [Gemmatimonadota bacterium]